jgi:hypothetical protein
MHITTVIFHWMSLRHCLSMNSFFCLVCLVSLSFICMLNAAIFLVSFCSSALWMFQSFVCVMFCLFFRFCQTFVCFCLQAWFFRCMCLLFCLFFLSVVCVCFFCLLFCLFWVFSVVSVLTVLYRLLFSPFSQFKFFNFTTDFQVRLFDRHGYSR